MREFSAGSYDVAVIGAGHAGIEASLAGFTVVRHIWPTIRVATMQDVEKIESYFDRVDGVLAVGTGSVHDPCRLACARHDVPLCLETTYLPPSFETLIDRDINGSLYATLRQEFHRAPAQGHKTFEVCYASQNEAFLLNVERGQALILITDYVYDTDGRPLHVSKRIQRTDRAKYTEPIG